MQTTAYVHDAAIHAVTRPCFERRALGGRHNLPFRVVFGGDGMAARFFGVSKMTVWRVAARPSGPTQARDRSPARANPGERG